MSDIPESAAQLEPALKATADAPGFRFDCANPTCDDGIEFTVGWLPELAHGWPWTCTTCGTHQLARLHLPESAEAM